MCRDKIFHTLQADRAKDQDEYIQDIPEGSFCVIVGCVELKPNFQWYYMMGNGTTCTNRGILAYIVCNCSTVTLYLHTDVSSVILTTTSAETYLTFSSLSIKSSATVSKYMQLSIHIYILCVLIHHA